jgi:GNAT superfamily N-acetyltransferase
VVVRPAQTDDLDDLCLLYGGFHEFHAARLPDRLASLGVPEAHDSPVLRAAIKEILQGADSIIYVAEIGGECVGLAEVYLRQDRPHLASVPHTYGYLQSLMVHEAHRRSGLGTRLVQAAHRWVRSRGGTEMRADLWEFAEGPLRFYEKVGYATLRRTMVRKL